MLFHVETINVPKYGSVEIRWYMIPENIPVRGNACAIDDDTDRVIENEVLDRLAEGDDWAWCMVECRAVWRGVIEGADYLGGCSFNDAADFLACNGDDMRANAINQLISEIDEVQL